MSNLHRRPVATEELIAAEIARLRADGGPDGCVETLEYLLAMAQAKTRRRREALRLAQRGLEMQAERVIDEGQADAE
jgi:hypothetical protein